MTDSLTRIVKNLDDLQGRMRTVERLEVPAQVFASNDVLSLSADISVIIFPSHLPCSVAAIHIVC